MRTTKNTILITGGSLGTGLELTRLLSGMGNHIIVVGNNRQLLSQVKIENKNVTTLLFDLKEESATERLIATLKDSFQELNVFINNAGQSYRESIESLYAEFPDTIESYYLSGIRIFEELLPHFKSIPDAAFIDASLLTMRFLDNRMLANKIGNILGSYSCLLRYKLQHFPNIDVPDMQAIVLEANSSPAMIAFRITETLFNRNIRNENLQQKEYRLRSFPQADTQTYFNNLS